MMHYFTLRLLSEYGRKIANWQSLHFFDFPATAIS